MIKKIAVVVAASAALSACAAPLVQPNPPSWQVKAEHLNDWQGLAQRAVAKIPGRDSDRPLVYVEPGAPNMPFAAAYKRYLEEALFAAGYPVASKPEPTAISLHFDVQWFYYGHGNQKPITNYASLYTTAGLILGQARNVTRVDTGLGVAAGVGPVLDFLAAMNDTTRAEVMLTTKIESGSRYHFLASENFYVQPRDLVFYLAPPEPLDMRLVQLPIAHVQR